MKTNNTASRQNGRTSDGRVPPHNLQAEESLIGAMLLSKDAIGMAVESCSSTDFYKPAHLHIYDAIVSLWGRGEPADVTTVGDELNRADLLEVTGGLGYLISLQANTPATSNAARYGEIVKEHSQLRKLIEAGQEICELGFSVPDDVPQALDSAESLMFKVAHQDGTKESTSMRPLLLRTLDNLEALYDSGESITGVPTGFADLDKNLLGLQPNKLYIVGARPAMGKSAWSLNVALNAALNGIPTLYFSLEMDEAEIAKRLISSDAHVDAATLNNGRVRDIDWPKIQHSIGKLADIPLRIDDDPNSSIMRIRSKARRMKSSSHGLGLVVVDYLQLMNGRADAETRQVQIAEMSRGLKILARELEIPVVALSQLSRTLETRVDKRPTLSDLRESGSLEQDADVVMFLYRDEVYNFNTPDRGTAEIIVAKNRNGPIGVTQLAFIGRYTKFANMAAA